MSGMESDLFDYQHKVWSTLQLILAIFHKENVLGFVCFLFVFFFIVCCANEFLFRGLQVRSSAVAVTKSDHVFSPLTEL